MSRGELLACQIAVLNQSSSELESVQVSVTQHVRWHAGGHTNHARRVLIAAPVAPQSLPGTVNLDKDLLKAMKEARKTNPQVRLGVVLRSTRIDPYTGSDHFGPLRMYLFLVLIFSMKRHANIMSTRRRCKFRRSTRSWGCWAKRGR